ncbi:hypothetical protein CRUP_020776 [Coryphaenoides rupestris]|nr:hypothetical protein CRUP_020776 [Coryphaenoides rupestris]
MGERVGCRVLMRAVLTSSHFHINQMEANGALRPRLCRMAKAANGYGFNLHSEKSKPGQFIRAVDDHSPAQRAGLLPRDKILQHAEVVAVIKAGGEETTMLVVDPEAESFFASCNVTPTEEHLTGPLPERVSRASMGDVNSKTRSADPGVPLSRSSSSSSSNASLPTAETVTDSAGGVSMTLAQAKERAHQKRAAKKAPPMDWSKRNELFSNL